jgi:hypothetical protein
MQYVALKAVRAEFDSAVAIETALRLKTSAVT